MHASALGRLREGLLAGGYQLMAAPPVLPVPMGITWRELLRSEADIAQPCETPSRRLPSGRA
jgi:hypothetical protein